MCWFSSSCCIHPSHGGKRSVGSMSEPESLCVCCGEVCVRARGSHFHTALSCNRVTANGCSKNAWSDYVPSEHGSLCGLVSPPPSYLQERKHHYCGDTLKSLKEEMRGKAEWVAWKWKRGTRRRGCPSLPFLQLLFRWPLATSFSGSRACLCWPRPLVYKGSCRWCHIPACSDYKECITHTHTYVRHRAALQEMCVSFYDSPSVSH